MAGYKELKVWQRGVDLALDVYRDTAGFPDDERFGLVSQMRRAAVSVPSNIAEGHARNTPGDMIRFSSISLGSLAEIETQAYISAKLGFLDEANYDQLTERTEPLGKMLHALIRSQRTQ